MPLSQESETEMVLDYLEPKNQQQTSGNFRVFSAMKQLNFSKSARSVSIKLRIGTETNFGARTSNLIGLVWG